ncbi:hypothetical protein DFJ74DRAFT_701754 [Hyaloraphidium curvatum]|nr:hypothetical protein DFJ74DRAFT_701754 [Hyaloraphidium curvatum]
MRPQLLVTAIAAVLALPFVAGGPIPRANDAAAAIALADASSAARLGESCSESTYAACTTGCCANGTCAEHAVCWPGPRNSNIGARCTASTPQQCDSGCCFGGKCAPVHACFPTGRGKRHGERCSASSLDQCSSGCCADGVCVSGAECFGDNGAPAVPLLASLLPSSNANCTRDFSGLATAGIVCPCDHIFVCGECLPAASEMASKFAHMNRDCSRADQIIAAWRNLKTKPEKDVNCPAGWAYSNSTFACEPAARRPPSARGDDLRKRSGSLVRRDAGKGEACVSVDESGIVKTSACASGLSCDPVLYVCVEKPTPLRLARFACPQGENSPSATAKIQKDQPPPGPFYDNQGLAVPLGACKKCFAGGFLLQCGTGTACDFASGLCLPVAQNDYDANAIGTLPCSGTKSVGTKVSAAAECGTCWADLRDMTCGKAPTGFVTAVSTIPKGLPSTGVPSGTPLRSDSGLTGYPSYSGNANALKTYTYTSCLLTGGSSSDLRTTYNNTLNFGAAVGNGGQADQSWIQTWRTAFAPICDCSKGAARSTAAAPQLQLRSGACAGITEGCHPFVADCARGVLTNVTAVLGNQLDCSAACDVELELTWLDASNSWLTAEDKMLASHFQNAKEALQEAVDLVASADNVAVQKYQAGNDLASSLVLGFQDAFGIASYLTSAAAAAGVEIAIDLSAIVGAEFTLPFMALLSAVVGLISEIMSIAGSFGNDYYQVFENGIDAYLAADQLSATLAQSLSATQKAFRNTILNTINQDRTRLFYLYEMSRASPYDLATIDYTSISKFSLAMKAGLKQQYVKELIPSRYSLCTVDRISDWIGKAGDDCRASPSGSYDCPSYCGDGRGHSGSYSYSGNPAAAHETTIGQYLTYPEFRGTQCDCPSSFVSLLSTFYWMCDKVDTYTLVNPNLMAAAGCSNGTVTRNDGSSETRWFCGPEKTDVAKLQFAQGYWNAPYYNVRYWNGVNEGGYDYKAPPIGFSWSKMDNKRMNTCVD